MASPFSYFRKHQKVFLAIAAVLAMVIFVFADMFTSMISAPSESSSGNEVFLQWDGGELTMGEFDRLRQRRLFLNQVLQNIYGGGRARIESEGGTPSPPSVPTFFLNQNSTGAMVALQVVDERVLANLAKEAGMVVSDETINKYLKEIGLGRVTDGEIENVLRRINRYKSLSTSEEVLFAGLRELLLGNLYLRSALAPGYGVQPTELWDGWTSLNRRVKLEAAVLPAEDFISEVPEPTDAQLVSFFEQQKNQMRGVEAREGGRRFPPPNPGFREPRKVKLKYLLGDVTEWTQKMLDEVTEEEIADYYERNKRLFKKYDPIFDDLETDSGTLDSIFQDENEGDSPEEEATEDTNEQEEQTESSTEEDSGAFEIEEVAEEADSSEESPETEAEVTEPESGEGEPAEEDTGALPTKSPFRLVALQDDLTEESAEAEDEKQPDDSLDESEQPASAAAAAAEIDSSDSDSEESAEDDSSYEPLEKVRDEIRRTLANDKAVDKLTSVMEGAYGKLTRAYNEYGRAVARAESQETEPPAVPDALSDLSSLAKETGLAYEETEPMAPSELFDTSVGKARDTQSQSEIVTQMVFGTELELHEPILAVDLDGFQYLVIKVEDIPTQIPEFEEVREDVTKAWKLAEAKKLAIERGEEIAKKAQDESLAIAAAMGEDSFELVVTDFFSHLTLGTTADGRGNVRLSDAPPLENLGTQFMTSVFSMKDDDILALPNFDRSQVYVARIDTKERTTDELHSAFLTEFGNSQEIGFVYQNNLQSTQARLRSLVFASVGYDRQGLARGLQSAAR